MAQDSVESYIKKSNIWSQEGDSLNTEYAFRSDFSNSSSNLKNTRTPTLNENYLLTIGTHTDYDTYYYVEGGYDHYNNIYVTSILNNDTITLSDNHTYIRKYPESKYISNLSNGTDTYVIKDAEARTAIANKQDTLVSGTNIKTINNTSILGSGNISISTGDYDNETITKNGDNELQTVAIVNPNTNNGAISPLKIWNGTEYQWNHGEPTVWNYWQTDVQAMWADGGQMPADVSWYYLAYGNNRFVTAAFSSYRTAYSTDDGITWTAGGNLPTSSTWSTLLYINNKFIIISRHGKTAYSTDDGVTWTAGGDLPTGSTSWNSMAYGEGRLVAIDYDSNTRQSAYSTDDGITWTAGGNLPTGSYISLAYGEDVFVAVTQSTNNKTAYSTDGGVTWTAGGNLPISSDWVVQYGNGRFVAISQSGKSAYSTDGGVTWTAGGDLPTSGSSPKIKFCGNMFVCVFFSNSTSAYSTDGGVTWIQSSMITSNGWQGLAYGNNKFITIPQYKVNCNILSYQMANCYTLDSTPTISSQVYSSPEITSTKTITSVGSGTITLSDNLVYNSTPSGNQNTYRTLGDAHPDWICNINNVGVKIGNTIIATDGSDLLPSQSGNNGKFLTTNGTTVSWGTVDALPSQSGQSGKYLTTNGTTASWGTITIPTVDQTYDGTSANAQSGVAIAGAGFLTNTATGTNALTILGNVSSYKGSLNIGGGSSAIDWSVGLGLNSSAVGQQSTAVGYASYIGSGATNSVAIGANAKVGYGTSNISYAIQLGYGTNSEASSFYVGTSSANNWKMLGSDGKIPDDRLNTTIARTSQIPTTTSQLTNNSGFITGISWGDITGTLSSQSDLNTALNNKANDSSVVHLSGDETINGGKTFNQAFIIGTTETHPNEGGQLIFKKSHNSTMAGDVIVDQNVNNLRVIGQSTSLGIIVPFYIDCENNKVYTATPTTGDNSTQVATTAFVKAQGYATTSQIPTVNDSTITIQKNGTTVDSFTTNASSGKTINITVPTTAADVSAVAANTAITSATKCKITYDSKGLVTAGADLSASDIPDISATYQTKLTSGTNIKTINSTSLLGSGDISITGLPSQTSQSGKFLTTNGTTASWATVDALPSQSGNSGKFLTTNGSATSWGNIIIPYGESTSAADAVQKEVTISEITELKTGQIIIVKPTITSTVADATLKLNNFTAYPMLYGAAAITTSTDSITWAANYPSWFRFDGSNWVFLGHGVDNNTTYSAMSVAEGTTGTKTTARSVRADYLKQIIQGTTLTGLSTSTNSAVVATDSITVGIGKLQAQVNNKVDKVSTASKIYATDASGNQTTLSYSASTTGNTVPVRGSNGTIEASTPYADSHVATKQYVDNLIPTIATTSTAGLVKPDGTSITVDANGTISAAGGSAYAMVIVDYTEEGE